MARYVCPECGYAFDEAQGDAHEGYAPGTLFSTLPEDFACPGCAVRFRDDFVVDANEPR
jgi:rubredoxin